MKKAAILFVLVLFLFPMFVSAQQRPDTTFAINLPNPAYQEGEGPTICIDSAHNNFHTFDGGYAPFARVMRADGYKVSDLSATITNTEGLKNCGIYMIVNPLHESNLGNWQLPTPSAFTPQEIHVINTWVENGGSLFLIADHMPFSGAAGELALSFGFETSNGFAFLDKPENQPDVFNLENGRLFESPVLEDEITTITSFTGSAFTYPNEAIPFWYLKKATIAWNLKLPGSLMMIPKELSWMDMHRAQSWKLAEAG